MSKSIENSLIAVLSLLTALLLNSVAQANILRDPMQPAHAAKTDAVTKAIIKKPQVKPAKAMKLSAISYTVDAPSRSAIINDLWVKHGSVVNGATVLHIGDNEVELVRNGKKFTVYLVPNIKSAPTDS